MSQETRPTILIAEDDVGSRRYLADQLTADDCDVLEADDAGGALRALATKFPDLVVLDVSLAEGTSGLDVLRAVRGADRATSSIDPYIPILVISGRSRSAERIRALELGADSFMPKPYSYGEIWVQMRALLRRSSGRDRTSRIRVGALEIDPGSRSVWLSGRPIRLTATEFALLRVLASQPTTVRTKPELLKAVWGYHGHASTRTLDSHVCRLRNKLRTPNATFIRNTWGIGYRLLDDPVPVAEPAPARVWRPRSTADLRLVADRAAR
jgi:DNA-binding response OmpR family regulator